MTNIVKNIYISGDVDAILPLISSQDPLPTHLAIELPVDIDKLKRLYKALASAQDQRFIFLLTEQEIPANITDAIGRFFFLANYYVKASSPLLVYRAEDISQASQVLQQWCKAQGFSEPEILPTKDFVSEAAITNDFIYVKSEQEKTFLPLYSEKIVKMEWLLKKIIFRADNETEARSLINELNAFAKDLMQRNTGIYETLVTLTGLEETVQKSQTIIKFLEMEISNQKLYNKLMSGEEIIPSFEVNYTNIDQMASDLHIFKKDRHRLLTEIGKLRSDLAWYKRTFEERSFMGVIKEKLFKKIKHR